MIPFSAIDKEVLAGVDAQGSDAYDLLLDRIPATNRAQAQLVAYSQSMFEDKRMSAEALRDLIKHVVLQSSHFGNYAIDALLALPPLEHRVWGIVAVHPEFLSEQEQILVTDLVATNSLLRTDIRFNRPLKSAYRSTHEKAAKENSDEFAPGNSVITDPAKVEYSYIYTGGAVAQGQVVGSTLQVLPHTDGQRRLCSVTYLKEPNLVPDMVNALDPLYQTTQLEWPASMKDLLVTMTLRMLSVKVGDNTTQYTLNSQEMGMMLNAIS